MVSVMGKERIQKTPMWDEEKKYSTWLPVCISKKKAVLLW